MSDKQRLGKRFADEVVDSFISPLLESQRELLGAIQLINKAHALMLVEERIISEGDGRKILDALLKMDGIGRSMPLDPYLHEIYTNIETKVVEITGPDVGGRMMTGRSRNDLYACAFRLVARERVLKILDVMLGAISALISQAEKHYDTVMPGFTHTQPAQPTTLGHYFLGFADSLGEDKDRLIASYHRTNQNPLGAGAFAGTGFPLNRRRTSELMGFRGLVENSIKAVGDYSYLLEILSCLAIMMNNVSRFTADLIPWTSAAYGMFEIDDSFACSSSIMPQKKNPFTAETIRSISGESAGALLQGLTVTKGTPMGFNFDLLCFGGWSTGHIRSVENAIRVLKGLVDTLVVHRDEMERHSWDGFSTATELADMLVRTKDMSFRTAHGVIASAVRMAIDAGKNRLSAEEINRAAVKELGMDLGVKEKELGVTVTQIVSGRRSSGAGAPDEVKRMASERLERVRADEAWLEKESKRVFGCSSALNALIRKRFSL